MFMTSFVVQIQRGAGYYEMDQLPGMRLIITSFEKACAILEKNPSRAARVSRPHGTQCLQF